MVILVAVTAVILNSGAADGTGGGRKRVDESKIQSIGGAGRDHFNNL